MEEYEYLTNILRFYFGNVMSTSKNVVWLKYTRD